MGLFNIFRKLIVEHDRPVPLPRQHHYAFAYLALPGLAFGDPHVPLGFGTDIPQGALAKFWAHVGAKLPSGERLSDSGLSGTAGELDKDHSIVLITMPKPLALTEAYFVAIVYPMSWFKDSQAYNNANPKLRYYILAKSSVAGGPDGRSGGSLRSLNQSGHGPIMDGIALSQRGFLDAIQTALRSSRSPMMWVNSKPWTFLMQDIERGETSGTI